MKTSYFFLLFCITGLFTSCSTAYQASNFEDDDIYFSSNDALMENQRKTEIAQQKIASEEFLNREYTNEYAEDSYSEQSTERKANSEDYYDQDDNTILVSKLVEQKLDGKRTEPTSIEETVSEDRNENFEERISKNALIN